jgi:hypothetical protein
MSDVGYGIGGYGVWGTPSSPSSAPAAIITYQALGPSAPMSNITESAVVSTGTVSVVSLALPVLMQAGQNWLVDSGSMQETVTVESYSSSPPAFSAVFANAHASGVPLVYVPVAGNTDCQWIPGPNNPLTNIYAVAQAILTRLKMFEGEWWANTADGLPLWQSILGQPAGNANQQQVEALISARINGTPYVVGLQNVNIAFNPSTRAYTYSAQVNTQFGSIVISNSPQPPSGMLPA